MGRRVRDAELQGRGMQTQCGSKRQWNRQSHIHLWWIKFGKDVLGARDSSHRPDHAAQGSSTRKINPHNF